MRRALLVLLVLAGLGVVVVLGVRDARDSEVAVQGAPEPLSLAEVSKPLEEGAPPRLAALRSAVNVIEGGGTRAFDRRLRALRGHPVVVNLWASYCDPCRFELPHFQRQALKRGAQVAFLGVNVGDSRVAAKELAARFPMPYPSFEDPRGALLGRYKAVGLPVTAFYDARGKLQIVRQGRIPTERRLSDEIERYALR